MPVTPAENLKYADFVRTIAQEMGVFQYQPDEIVWHYTDGLGFLGILQSSTIYATQVSSLNDRNETKYATDLYRASVEALLAEKKQDQVATAFLGSVLGYVKDNPELPAHGMSKFFVTCFSGEEDDLTQWDRYGKRNGYAIGFYARGFWRGATSTLYRVIYDRSLHQSASKRLAEAMLAFYLEGLTVERATDIQKWTEEFFVAWDEWIYKLAPLAKDQKWKAENEFRLVHELASNEASQVPPSSNACMGTSQNALTTDCKDNHRTW